MRTVAAWSLSQTCNDTNESNNQYKECKQLSHSWLERKGVGNPTALRETFTLANGKVASLSRDDLLAEQGNIESFTISEPWGNSGTWHTRFTLAQHNSSVALFCQMQVSTSSSIVSDDPIDPNCPTFLRDIMGKGDWIAGNARIPLNAAKYLRRAAATDLTDLIWNPHRRLPVVVVSEYDDFTLHPGVEDALARELRGVAHVCLVDTDAAWGITELKGKDWSCFWGAIRLYWPFSPSNDNPYRHPFWTPDRLRRGNVSTFVASRRLRNTIRGRIFSRSTALREPDIITRIRREHTQRTIEEAKESAENLELAASYSADVERLERQIEEANEEVLELKEANAELEARLDSANERLTYHDDLSPYENEDRENPKPDPQPQLDSVEEALRVARKKLRGILFGKDVDDEASRLASDAGPPSKVYEHLSHLDEMADLLMNRSGSLGTTQMQWLRERNIEVSGENETTLNSPAAMQRRTWDDGLGGRRAFTDHLKTSNATSPDRCVRIYYEWDSDAERLIVGCVGRHPD